MDLPVDFLDLITTKGLIKNVEISKGRRLIEPKVIRPKIYLKKFGEDMCYQT